jgi:hypothetical protein
VIGIGTLIKKRPVVQVRLRHYPFYGLALVAGLRKLVYPTVESRLKRSLTGSSGHGL